MARRYVCGICGRTVATFSSWADVEPSHVIELLSEELRGHRINTSELENSRVLARFRIVDEDDAESPAAEADDGRWEGQ